MDSRPGDILMWVVGNRRWFYGHTAIVIEPGIAGAQLVQTPGEHTTVEFRYLSDVHFPPKWVYQCRHAALAKMAAGAATSWESDASVEDSGVVYGKGVAFESGLARPGFAGQRSQNRASEYRLHGPSSGRGCPESFKRRGRHRSTLFCSMLVIAAYHSVTRSNEQLLTYIGRDAVRTSPLDLHIYLGRNTANWDRALYATEYDWQ